MSSTQLPKGQEKARTDTDDLIKRVAELDEELHKRLTREIAVLFTDIRGYTTLAETMTPEENFKFVNAIFSRMGPIIRECNGFVNQYLGE